MVASELETDQWTQPTKAHGPRWNGFLMSALRNNCSGRRQAKCSYCSQLFTHGKPERLFRHIQNACTKVPAAEKRRYLESQMGAESSTETDIPTSAEQPLPPHGLSDDSPIVGTPFKPHKRKARSDEVESDLKPQKRTRFDEAQTEELHSLLLKALLTSDVPLRLLENYYFQQYQRELARSLYEVPRQASMADLILPCVHAQIEGETCARFWDVKNLSLSLDGRIDAWGNATYAVVVVKGSQLKRLIDILDIPQQQHSAENIFMAVQQSIREMNIENANISSVVTDSRPIMIKFQEIFNAEQPHIVSINCILHVLNSLTKDFLSHPMVQKIVEDDKILVDYFTATEEWNQHLRTWQNLNGVTPGLQTLSSNPWVSLPKICADVSANEGGFKYCQQILHDPSMHSPAIPESVLNIITNQDHFRSNESLTVLFKPVVDSSERLKFPGVNLADVWRELIMAYKALEKASVQVQFEELREYCLQRLRTRSMVFDSDLYIMAFFLHPIYRRVVKRSLEEITRMILQYAKICKYTRGEAISLREQLGRYYGNLLPFTFTASESDSQSNALSYWDNVPDSVQTSALKRLAVTVLEIVPHTDSIEGLLPIISATRTNTYHQMTSTALRQMCMVRYNLLQEIRNAPNITTSILDGRQGSCGEEAYDSFEAHSYIDAGADGSLTPELIQSEKDSCFFTSFDLNAWEEVNAFSDNPPMVEFDENWELDEIFASFC